MNYIEHEPYGEIYHDLVHISANIRTAGTHIIFELDSLKGCRITQLDSNSKEIFKEAKYFTKNIGICFDQLIKDYGKTWFNLEDITSKDNIVRGSLSR